MTGSSTGWTCGAARVLRFTSPEQCAAYTPTGSPSTSTALHLVSDGAQHAPKNIVLAKPAYGPDHLARVLGAHAHELVAVHHESVYPPGTGWPRPPFPVFDLETLGELPALEHLSLTRTTLHGPPAYLGALRSLALTDATFDTLAELVANCPSLERLRFTVANPVVRRETSECWADTVADASARGVHVETEVTDGLKMQQ